MSTIKQIKWNSTANLIIMFALGLLLLIFPIESLNIACYLIASLLFLTGVSHIIKIAKNKQIENNGDIATIILSIIAIGISITIFIDPTWIIRIINIIIGLLLILNSAINISNLFKFKKDRTSSWWIFLVFIVLILVLGILIIVDPEFLAKIVIRLEGATLIFNTLLTMILSYKVNKLLELPNKSNVVKEINVD